MNSRKDCCSIALAALIARAFALRATCMCTWRGLLKWQYFALLCTCVSFEKSQLRLVRKAQIKHHCNRSCDHTIDHVRFDFNFFLPGRSLKYWQTEPRKLRQNCPRLQKAYISKYSCGRGFWEAGKARIFSSLSSFNGHVHGQWAIFTKRRSGGIMAAMCLFWQSRIREAQTRFLYCAWVQKYYTILHKIHTALPKKARVRHYTTTPTLGEYGPLLVLTTYDR